ncbi:MAG: zinc ribbon domain-containing protein, partial [Firmicutes bacterium]|nr:zinc ribbon domain-containing protein [Bacillota bacterium]
MAKFCPDCGVQNPDIGKFCVSCGKAFPQAALMPPIDPIAQPPPPPPSTVPAPESPMEPVTQPAAPAPEQEPSANFTIAGALTAAFLAPGPQSLGDIVIEKLRQIWTNLKKNWKRTLWIKILGSLLFFGLFILATMVFQGMIADTYLISNWARKGGLFKLIGNLWPYLVISQDSKLHVFKGLQFLEGLRKIFTSMPKEIKTSYLVTPLYMIFPAFVMSLLLRIKAGGRRFFRDLAGLPQTIFKYMGLKQRGAQGYGVAMALLLCFLLLNPVTAAVLALWALISVSNRYGSGLMLFFSAGKMDINRINNRAPKHRVESAVGASGGFAVGMVLASAVNLLVWLLFEYRMWS